MKKLCCVSFVMLLVAVVVSVECMEQNVPWVSKKGLLMAKKALNVRPDTFAVDYFNKLSSDDRALLINSSVCCPELTRRLIEAYFADKDLCAHIKSFFKEENEQEKEFIRHCCKTQLILNKRLLGLKQSTMIDDFEALNKCINLQSLFMNGYHSPKQCERSIPLCIGGEIYQTYAAHFVAKDYEFRVTDIASSLEPLTIPSSAQCLLWVINHKKSRATFSTLIKHTADVKGCCFSKTGTDVEYVVTYSDNDMVFSKITMSQDEQSFVESMHVDTPNQGTIVSACFNPVLNNLMVGTYEGRDSVFRAWGMNGVHGVEGRWKFEDYGLLKQIFSASDVQSGDMFVYIFGVGGMYAIWKFNGLGNAMLAQCSSGYLRSLSSYYDHRAYYADKVISTGQDSIFMYSFVNTSSFAAINAAAREKQQSSFFDGLVKDFSFEPDGECHRKYSPDGKFLMCNSLKKKLGLLYVETQVQNSITHRPIITIDTLYKNFAGVGFTHDSTELIFLNHNGPNETVSLYTSDDEKMLQEFEAMAFKDCAVTFLLKRLCKEYKKKGCLTLSKNDPARIMLMDWWRAGTPGIKKILEACFPLPMVKK